MKYDLSNPIHVQQFKIYAQKLAKRGTGIAELKVGTRRSLPQNAYLHVILSYLASQTGVSVEYAKEWYFKRLANPSIFLREWNDPFAGQTITYLRSTAEITKEEMTDAIDNFLQWTETNCGFRLPEADEKRLLELMEVETERSKIQ